MMRSSSIKLLLSTLLFSVFFYIAEGKYVRAKVDNRIGLDETQVFSSINVTSIIHETRANVSMVSTNFSTARSLAGNFIYIGGPVLSNVKIVLVLWGGSSNVRFATQLQSFYAAITSSSWYKIMSEYKTPTQSIGSGSLIATYSDTSAPTGALTQTTIESRLKSLISTGKVPAPDSNTYYAIHFATGTKSNDQCQTSGGGTVCGWHSMTYSSSNKAVYYGAMPDQVGCGFCDSGNGLNDILGLSSHELSEAVTDPGVGDGWLDSSGNEIADVCDSVGSTVGSDGQTYPVQLLWSNLAGKCIVGVSSPVPAPIPSPVSAPVASPVAAPVPSPVAAPVSAPSPVSSFPFRTSKGPIRGLQGRCVDVNGGNFTNGNQLQIKDCKGSNAQQWFRPSSTDLRLQTSNSLCMDAYGNAGSGGAVVLSPCSNNSNSQKWLYDGRNLRPMHNTGLCLNINGGVSVNGAKLIVSLCNNGSSSAWVGYSMSSVYGKVPSGVSATHLLCPVGSKVVNISGRGGSWVDQLTATCDDGRTTLGPAGGSGGSLVTSPTCTSGYNGVNIISGQYIGQVNAKCLGSSSLSALIGKGLSSGSGSSNSLQLSGNQSVIGMQIYSSGLYVNAISFLYAAATSMKASVPAPVPSPVAAPVSPPVAAPTSSADGGWLQAHNVRRQKYHSMYGVSYVPLKWSSSIAQSAQGYANKLIAMSGCVIQHGYQGDSYGGENLYANWGSSGVTSATPDQVLQAWAENEVSSVGGHFTQVIWRGTRYVGCATASKSNCYIQVCRYIAPGNCNLSSSNWKQTTLADSSPCGPQCPAEGCF